jgi:hypothetical protein
VRPVLEFVQEAKSLSRTSFMRSHAEPFLLHSGTLQPGVEPQGGFETRAFAEAKRPAALSQALRDGRLDLAIGMAAPLTKRAKNPFLDRIYVGRTANNDVVVPQTTVSKVHAYFTKKDDGAWYLVDCGSHNRTFIEEQELARDQPHRLADGAAIAFGGYAVLFLESGHFYEVLRRWR